MSGPPLSAADVFQADTAAGDAVTGPLREIRAGWAVRLGGDKPGGVAAGELVVLRRVGVALPAPPAAEQVVLVNGDRLPVKGLKLLGEKLQVVPDFGDRRELSLPLAAVALVWLAPPDGTLHPDRLRRRLAAAPRKRDALWLANGDLLEGVLTALDDAKVSLEIDKKAVTVDRHKAAALGLAAEPGNPPRAKGPYGRLVLANGARLSLASAACTDGKVLSGTTPSGAAVRVPVADVVALYVHQGKAVYLSDLKPSRSEHAAWSGESPWPPVFDGSVDGRDLRVGGGTYDKGLGVHSQTALTYDLAGGYRRFEALVGLDDATGRRGSVRVRALVDGKACDLGGGKELTHAAGPLAVRLDVTGAKELTLVVEFGRGGDVQDHVNWADARLVR